MGVTVGVEVGAIPVRAGTAGVTVAGTRVEGRGVGNRSGGLIKFLAKIVNFSYLHSIAALTLGIR